MARCTASFHIRNCHFHVHQLYQSPSSPHPIRGQAHPQCHAIRRISVDMGRQAEPDDVNSCRKRLIKLLPHCHRLVVFQQNNHGKWSGGLSLALLRIRGHSLQALYLRGFCITSEFQRLLASHTPRLRIFSMMNCFESQDDQPPCLLNLPSAHTIQVGGSSRTHFLVNIVNGPGAPEPEPSQARAEIIAHTLVLAPVLQTLDIRNWHWPPVGLLLFRCPSVETLLLSQHVSITEHDEHFLQNVPDHPPRHVALSGRYSVFLSTARQFFLRHAGLKHLQRICLLDCKHDGHIEQPLSRVMNTMASRRTQFFDADGERIIGGEL